jgi:hypothetical protein
MKCSIDVNNPLEDPHVYYTDEQGRKLRAKIELIKGGFWRRKGKVKLYLNSFNSWENSDAPLTLSEYQTALKRIVEDLNEHDLLVDFI